MLVNTFSPSLPLPGKPDDATVQKLVNTSPGSEGNRLYVPQINVDVAISEGTTVEALEKGAWHRNPENGDPKKGGNFVLSAHRFQLELTPQQTKAASPFYNIDKLQAGDELYVDWAGKRYAYRIEEKTQVDMTATEIEAKTKDSQLTLYSCDLRGEAASREVVIAKPLGEVSQVKNPEPS